MVGETSWKREREEDRRMGLDLAEAGRCLAAVVAAIEAGELDASQAELAGLRGALVVVECLTRVHNTTV